MHEVREPAPDGGAGPAGPTDEEVAERLDEPDHEPERHQPEQPGQRVRREEHPHPRAGQRELVGPVAAQTVVGRLAVRDARVGRDEHAGAGEPRPPAEIEVLGARERRGVEALELLEEVGAHEHGRGGDVEHVAHAVVLLLVDLAGLDPGVGRAEAVDGAADLEQDLGVVGAHQLRTEDAGVRPVRLLDEHAQRGRVEHHVVVAQEQERGALDRVERLVGRAGEAGAVVEAAHERAGQHLGDPGRRVVVGPAVDDEHGEVVVVLGAERGQACPRATGPGCG